MTLEDVKEIVELYLHFDEEYETLYREWMYDEDQTGIPNPYDKTRDEICEDVFLAYKHRHKNN